jgi:hypothetical protein
MALDPTFAFAQPALPADAPASSTVMDVSATLDNPKSARLPLQGGSLTSTGTPRQQSFNEPLLMASSIALPFNTAGIGAGLRAALSQVLQSAESSPKAAGLALQQLARVWPGGWASLGAASRALGASAMRWAAAAIQTLTLPEVALTAFFLALFQQPAGSRDRSDMPYPDGIVPPSAKQRPTHPAASQSTLTSPSQRLGSSKAAELPVPAAHADIGSLPIGKLQVEFSARGQSNVSAAKATLSQATPLLTPINDALKQFYYAASGGLAARTAHQPQEQVKLIQGLYGQLQKVVADSNSSIAAVGSAAHSLQAIYGNPANSRFLFQDLSSVINDLKSNANALGASRNALKTLVASLGTWLEQAHAFVKGGSHVLPKPPSQLAGTSDRGADKAVGLGGAYKDAQTALSNAAPSKQAPVKTASAGMLGKAALMVTAAETIGWFNPASRSFSPTQTSAGDVQVTAQWADTLPAGGGARMHMTVDPRTGMPTPDKANGVPVTGTLYPTDDSNEVALFLNKTPGNMPGQKPDDPEGPKTPKDQLGWMKKVIAGITGFAGLGTFIAQGVYGQHGAEEGKRVQSTTPDFKLADANAKKILDALSPSSTKDQKETAREAIWRGYFEAANETLDELEWNRVLNVPFLGGGKMFTPQDMKLIRDSQGGFYDRLKGTPIETSAARPRSPRLLGDTYKMDHANHVLEQVDDAASAQVRQIASNTAPKQDDPTPPPAPFDVNSYVDLHKLNISTPRGYRDAQAAIWKHHLQPVFAALGKVHGYAAKEKEFLKFTNSWLQDSWELDFRDLTMLPNNSLVQETLAACISPARLDLDRLNQAMPMAGSNVLKTVLAGLPAGGKPAATSTKLPVVSAQNASRPTFLEAKAVLARVTELIKIEKLNQPPSTATLADIKFTPDMFFAAGERHTSKTIPVATAKAEALFEKIRSEFEYSTTGAVRTAIDNVLINLKQSALELLRSMPPEAEIDPTPPSPAASPTLTPEQQTQIPSPTTAER